MPTLRILQGPDKGHTFEISQTPALIGRGSPDLPLTDNTVSRRHAQLLKKNGRWAINDLNSANGTYVNGVKISAALDLRQGDQIRCGATLIVFGDVSGTGVPGALGSSLRIDEDGKVVESSIVGTAPSLDDSVIIAAPETGSAVANLRLIYELSNAINTVFDPQQLLERVVDMIFQTLPADRGFILLRTEPQGELQPCVVRYRSPEHTGEIAVSHTIVNHVLEHKEGVICSNAMCDPRFAKGKSVQNYGIRSALCAPITVRDQVIGVIYIDSTVATHTYAGEQLRLLTAMGRQTGLAIEHARLYQQGIQAERLAATGETVAYLSHGIKNILQSLQSASDMVALGLQNNRLERARQGWAILERNLAKIQNLVLNMLAFSKVRTPNLVLTQLNQIIAEVVEMVAKQADEKRVALLTDLEPHLPAMPLDPDGMQQVLLNLVLNALDAVEPDEGAITIKTAFHPDPNEAVLSVADNGCGIDPERLKTLFSAFVSDKGQRGTGLGLAVVRNLVEEHGGTVDVVSTPGEGTTFTVRLPASGPKPLDSEGTAGAGQAGDTTLP